MTNPPSPNGSNGDNRGRSTNGRFVKGNPGGPGNPSGGRVAQFRSVLLGTVSDADLAAVAKVLIKRAKAGEAWAVRELLDRLLGRPEAIDLLERLDRLEALAKERSHDAESSS